VAQREELRAPADEDRRLELDEARTPRSMKEMAAQAGMTVEEIAASP